MHLDAIRVAIEVERRGSFAGVARDHDMEPSSISRIVGSLETDLGFRLFQRTTRHMSLTEAGAVYLRRVAPAVAEIDRAYADGLAVTAGPAGQLRMTASVAFGATQIVPLLPSFRRAYPNITVELALTDAKLDLVTERIDVAIRLASSVSGDVVATKLRQTRYRVCATACYLDTHGVPRRPADLARHRCLLFALPEYRTRWRFRPDRDGPEQSVAVAGDIVISSALALREAALLGLGPALLPDWLIANDLATGRLQDLFPKFQVAAADFATAAWLVYPTREHLPSKIRVAVDFFRHELARRQAGS